METDERINLAGAFFKRPDRTLAECQRHYAENHGPLICATEDFSRDILRYTQHRRIDMPGFAPPDPGIAGVSQLLYRDLATIREAFVCSGYKEQIYPDELRLSDISRSYVVIGPVETVIVGGEDAPLRLFRFVQAGEGGYRRAYAEAIAKELQAMVAGFSQTFSLVGEENPWASLFDGHDELRFDDAEQAQAFLREEERIGQSPAGREGVIAIAGEYRRFI
jgi:hypothetical protein